MYQEDLAQAVDDTYECLGEPVTYRFAKGGEANLTAIPVHDLTPFGDVAEITATTVIFRVRIAKLGRKPARLDKLEIDDTGEVFQVDSMVRKTRYEYFISAA